MPPSGRRPSTGSWLEQAAPPPATVRPRSTRAHDYDDLIAGRRRLQGVRSFLVSRGISLPEGSPDDPPAGPHRPRARKPQESAAPAALARRDGVAAFSGSRSYLEAARMAGLARAVVSPSANTGAILRHAGLSSLVDAKVDGSMMEVGASRVRSRRRTRFVAACRLLDIEPNEAAAVRDHALRRRRCPCGRNGVRRRRPPPR